MLTEFHASAEALERFLGDPALPSSAVSFQQAVALDEQEAFPEAEYSALTQWGLHHYYIPIQLGGQLRSVEELLMVGRAMSRRDLTLAIGHGKSYLGMVPVWAAGTPEQQRRLAEIASTGAPVSLGLTERAHGSDLLATEVRATPNAAGFSVSGEKWLINNATRCKVINILARTGTGTGPRDLSLITVEKGRLAPGSYRQVPKIRTHGIRGADISGIFFEGAQLPQDALVGTAGTGLETVLKVIQLTRLLCASFSLGGADTALRCTLDFARNRKLYNQTVFSIPSARRTLVEAFADLLLAENVAMAGARLAQLAPEQLSVGAAVVKYFVPATVEAMIQNVAVVLGARHYIRQEHWHGIFQKVMRDAAVVSLFDGSTAVNLHSLGLQLTYLLEGALGASQEEGRAEAVFRLGTPVPLLEPSRLSLSARGRDTVVQSLRGSLERLRRLEGQSGVDSGVLAGVLRQTTSLVEELSRMRASLAELEEREGIQATRSTGLFELSRRYCAIYAAAACLGVWLYNRDRLGPYFQRGGWVQLCLNRISPGIAEPAAEHFEEAAREMEAMIDGKRLFSVISLSLAGA